MIVSLLAALALQTTPVISAECIFNGMGPAPCHIMIQRDGSYIGYGFILPGGNTLVFATLKLNDTQSVVQMLSANGSPGASVDGACINKPAERMVGCTAIVNEQRVTVVARTND